MFWSVRPLVTGHISSNCRVEFCVHDEPSLLPVQLSEVFLRRALPVVASGVDFIVAVSLKDIEDGRGLFKCVNACLLDS